MEPISRTTAEGVPVLSFAVLGSTNSEAIARARAGTPGPFWITADSQTDGRGRRRRAWWSPAGNLHASLLLSDPCIPQHAPELSFVAALALHEALIELAPELRGRLRLKWPNDVLLDGAKLAGILAESESAGRDTVRAVIGFGVNCVSHPGETSYGATDLTAAGLKIAPERVLDRLDAHLQARRAEWARGVGFRAIRDAWVARAARLHEPIRLSGAGTPAGIFIGLDDHGRLLLRGADGATQAFTAGEVHWVFEVSA